ncbi:MAG: dipeptidase PepE [Niabella sp.]
MKRIILASTSALYGEPYLDYLKDVIVRLFEDIKEVVFIPYARPSGISHDDYTYRATEFFKPLGIAIKGLHTFDDPAEALRQAQAFFTGGGNTFLLTKMLHELSLMRVLKEEVEKGKPYLGTSAGSNIAGVNIRTTNDMPIVFPPSFDAMHLVPFNLNPHYLDPMPDLKHNGETRETRLFEFLTQNNTPVVGLREGSWIEVQGEKTSLGGALQARIFKADKLPYELPPGSPLVFE